MNYIRQARYEDIERIAEILVFNYRLNFYPIFCDDGFYFEELTVAKQTANYMNELDSIWVYDDGVVNKKNTCYDVGEKIFTCKNCGYKKSEATARKEHEWLENKYSEMKYICNKCCVRSDQK